MEDDTYTSHHQEKTLAQEIVDMEPLKEFTGVSQDPIGASMEREPIRVSKDISKEQRAEREQISYGRKIGE